MAISNFTAARVSGAFMDKRIFLVKADDKRLGVVPNAPITVQQSHDGPLFISISAEASDNGLHQVHEQYKVSLQELRQFRAAQHGGAYYG